jgi:hypothetical protein
MIETKERGTDFPRSKEQRVQPIDLTTCARNSALENCRVLQVLTAALLRLVCAPCL